MADALRVSTAPVIFSHSGARGVTDVVRNVPDDILKQVRTNGGVVMVNFYSCYLIPDCDSRNATLQDVVGGESTTGTPSYRHHQTTPTTNTTTKITTPLGLTFHYPS